MTDREISATLRLRIGQFFGDLAKGRQGAKDFFRDLERDAKTSGDRAATQMGAAGQKAGDRFGDGVVKGADGRLRNSSGRFASAAQAATVGMDRPFGQAGVRAADRFVRDSQGRLRDHRGRFIGEGERLGASLGQGIRRGAKRSGGLGDIVGNFGQVFTGSRAMFLLAGGAAAAVGALQGVPPVIGAIGGALGAIPGLAAGAMGSLATLALGGAGVGGAIGEVFNPKGGGGGGGGGGGIDRTAAAIRRLEQAERQLNRAQADAAQTQEELNAARQEARRSLRDMTLDLKILRQDEQDAVAGVADAERELADLRERAALDPSGFTQADFDRAEAAVVRAKLGLEETRNRLGDLTVDQAKAAKAGVEGSDQVRSALQRQRDALDAVKDAQYGVLDAQEALAQAAMGSGGGGGGGAPSAYSKLGREAKQFVDEIRRLKPDLVDLQRLAQDRIFSGWAEELRTTAQVTLPFARTQVIRFADSWNAAGKAMFRLGRDPQFLAGLDVAFKSSDRFFDNITARVPATGRTLSHLFTGSQPYVDRFGDSLLSYVDDFNDSIAQAAADGRLDRFFRDAAEQADALLDLGKEVLRLIGRIGGASQGSTVLRDMADALQAFNDEAHQMRNVEGIIATGNVAIRGLVDVLLILGEALGDSLADPGTRAAVEQFFEILGFGAEVIANLLRMFGQLPDGMQSTLLVAAALALVTSRLFGGFDKLSVAAGNVNTRLRQTGAVGERAGRGLETTTLWAGRAVKAFIALQIAGAVLGSMRGAGPDVDKLADSLQHLAVTGERAGELGRMFKNNADGWLVFGDSDRLTADWTRAAGSFNKVGVAAEAIIPGLRELNEAMTGGSSTGAAENIKALDQALARMVANGNAAQAREAVSQIAASTFSSIEEVEAKLTEYSAAVTESGRTMNGTLPTIKDYNQAMQDQADAVRNSMEAQIELEETYDRSRATIDRNGRAWDINTQKGRDNQRAVLDLASGINTAAVSRLRDTGSVEQANQVLNTNRQRLIELAVKAGASRIEAAKLATQLLKTPSVAATFSTPGLANAVRLAYEYNEMLNRIRRNARAGGFGVGGNFLGVGGNRWGGLYEHRRWGGVDERPTVKAQAGVLRGASTYSPVAPGRYMIAEPATGGEFFGPKYGNLARTRTMAEYAVRNWWGGEVRWGRGGDGNYGRPAGGGTFGRPAMTIIQHPGPSAGEIGAAVAAHLSSSLQAAAGQGRDVVVYMDSVEIYRASLAGERSESRRG